MHQNSRNIPVKKITKKKDKRVKIELWALSFVSKRFVAHKGDWEINSL